MKRRRRESGPASTSASDDPAGVAGSHALADLIAEMDHETCVDWLDSLPFRDGRPPGSLRARVRR